MKKAKILSQLTPFILTLMSVIFLSQCGLIKTQNKKSKRTPASIESPMQTEADQFIEEIENAPSKRY